MLTTTVAHGLFAANALSNEIKPSVMSERQILTKGQELFAEGDVARFVYRVASGTVLTSKLMSDARRQIADFHLSEDILGLEYGRVHSCGAAAVEDSVVIAYERTSFEETMRTSPDLAEEILAATTASLERARAHMLLLARKTPRERIAIFLLDMALRLNKGRRLVLPMARADIADYLGLTKETVSRTFTLMAREGLIRLEALGRIVLLSDERALAQLNA